MTQRTTYDDFLADKITLEEQFRRKDEELKNDTAVVME